MGRSWPVEISHPAGHSDWFRNGHMTQDELIEATEHQHQTWHFHWYHQEREELFLHWDCSSVRK